MKSGPHHEREQPDDFERNGLAPRIRPGDHQDADRFIHVNIVRDNLILRDEQQRMPRLLKHDAAIVIQCDRVALQPTTHLSPCSDHITFRQHLDPLLNLIRVGGH